MCEFKTILSQFTNNLISQQYKQISILSLNAINEELNQSLKNKKSTLVKLKEAYQSFNIINLVENNEADVEMINLENVQIISNPHYDYIFSLSKEQIMILVSKASKNSIESKNRSKKENLNLNINLMFEKIIKELITLDLKLTTGGESIPNSKTFLNLARVWQIFEQYYKHMQNYDNHYKNFKPDIKETNAIVRAIKTLKEIGPLNI